MSIEIIAEIGQNHNGDMDLAKKMIHLASKSGANVAKFQLYDAKKLFPPREENEWFDYNCKTELSFEQVKELSLCCKENNIEFMASVFDTDRVEWLEEINVSRYKIASRSIFDKSLLDRLIKTNKPILISLGKWNSDFLPEIHANNKIDFLYCVSKYPTYLNDIHWKYLDFNKFSGFSDHTIGNTASMVAMSRGAKIIEKHFTLDKHMYGPDHSGSMTPVELSSLVNFKNEILQIL